MARALSSTISSSRNIHARSDPDFFTYNQSGTVSGNNNDFNSNVQISGDDSVVLFDSPAGDLFPGDRNENPDVFAITTAGLSSLSGQVFNDANGNGSSDSGEQGLQYWTVYLDANDNGHLDPSESFVLTDATGNFSFTGLTPGTYTVAIVPQAGYLQTTPATSYTVTIATDGTVVAGKNFGEQFPCPIWRPPLLPSPPAEPPTSARRSPSTGPLLTVAMVAASGSWVDNVYLSPIPTLGVGEVLLEAVTHNGGLTAGQSYLRQRHRVSGRAGHLLCDRPGGCAIRSPRETSRPTRLTTSLPPPPL